MGVSPCVRFRVALVQQGGPSVCVEGETLEVGGQEDFGSCCSGRKWQRGEEVTVPCCLGPGSAPSQHPL